ncbi:MAG: ribonuclease catalytic domain-containing protein, partial [Solirubrobacterales bacterium]
MALVELGQGRGRAKVVRELGDPERAADVIAAMLEDRQVRTGFARRIEREAAEAAERAKALDFDRRDLRDLPTFTVDPASAHDFDDAVSASRTERGVRLWIHIADVAVHVRPGDALEKEAYRRANSTYVPGTVAPMLPHVLSSDVCSLAPDADRLAVTSEIELSEAGEPLSASFYRSRIRSDLRLNYEQLDEIFAGRAQTPEPIAEPLALARKAAAALAGRRPRASLEVESFEPEFRFEEGQVTGAHSVPQTEAHRLIEHLMILTNERVADQLERRRIPTLYRVHEQPDPDRIRWLIEQLAALDVPTPALADQISPQQAGELAGEASRLVAREAERRGHGREAYT